MLKRLYERTPTTVLVFALLALLGYGYARDRIDDARYCEPVAREYRLMGMKAECPATFWQRFL